MSDFIMYLHKCTNHSKSFISDLFFKVSTPKITVYMIKFQSSTTQHRMISLWKFYQEDTSKKSSHTCSEESSFMKVESPLFFFARNQSNMCLFSVTTTFPFSILKFPSKIISRNFLSWKFELTEIRSVNRNIFGNRNESVNRNKSC